MRKKLRWYGVRSQVRLVATGKPKRPGVEYDPESTLVEDRVVLFRAESFESVIAQGEAEAREYCRRIRFSNIYGQNVRLKFAGIVDAFSMADFKPGHAAEVYSGTTIVPSEVTNQELLAARTAPPETPGARYKFIDARLLRAR